jgi:hypothetical protein
LKRNFLVAQAASDERRNLMLTGRQAISVHLEVPSFRWILRASLGIGHL